MARADDDIVDDSFNILDYINLPDTPPEQLPDEDDFAQLQPSPVAHHVPDLSALYASRDYQQGEDDTSALTTACLHQQLTGPSEAETTGRSRRLDGTSTESTQPAGPPATRCQPPQGTSKHRPLAPAAPGVTLRGLSSKRYARFVNTGPDAKGQVPRVVGKRGRLDKQQLQSFRKTRVCGPEAHCTRCRKKALPQSLCCRDKVKDLKTYSEKGLAEVFLDRYSGCISYWKPETQRKVKIWHGFGEPLQLTVEEYEPKVPVIDLFWKSPTGWQNLSHTRYGLKRMGGMSLAALDAYVYNLIPLVIDRLALSETPGSPFFRRAMAAAFTFQNNCKNAKIAGLLRNCLQLWAHAFLQYHGLWHVAPEGKDNDGFQDKLGMTQLVLHSHDVKTLTPFHGTIPLPRLLHQQIHTCAENSMKLLDGFIVEGLDSAFEDFRSTTEGEEPDETALGLYLATFVYLSVLEEVAWDAGRWEALLEAFAWPLERKPDYNRSYSAHAARVVSAHLHAAFRNRSIWQILGAAEPPTQGNRLTKSPTLNVRGERHSLDYLQLNGEDLGSKRTATFDNEDIASLELHYSALILEPTKQESK
ncbi:hypothetical protein INS49_015622 [Diaporthe citri]|uniref:uncharacterized protein n=1 Tax=Diaporthe citri TaxID=83186 RepID=UPI001C8102A4|nr:uncharacterized protein INS49_015622 [Diaporthe citri]KAG6356235.1 hypothetical protein INS49_015622 [Diaporthe citri]